MGDKIHALAVLFLGKGIPCTHWCGGATAGVDALETAGNVTTISQRPAHCNDYAVPASKYLSLLEEIVNTYTSTVTLRSFYVCQEGICITIIKITRL
jgi:hypothetical protein